jgi:hypothetical protein
VAVIGIVVMATGGAKRPAPPPLPERDGPEVSSGNLDDVIPEFLPPGVAP